MTQQKLPDLLMLSTGFSIALLVISLLTVAFCIAVTVWLRRMQRYLAEAVQTLHTQNKRSLSLARMAEVEATLTELSDAYNALLESHKKLRSRITMRENRQKKKNGAESDDDDASRANLKRELRDRARAGGHRGL